MKYAYDVVLALLIIFMGYVGYSKGLVSMAVSLAKWVIAILIAAIFSGIIANAAYTSFVKPAAMEVLDKYSDKIETANQISDAIDKLERKYEGSADNRDSKVKEIQKRIKKGENASEAICDVAVLPITVATVKPIAWGILFIVVFIICFIIEIATKLVNKLPILGDANKVLGIPVGILKGFGLSLAITLILVIVAGLLDNKVPGFNRHTFNDTIFMKFFMNLIIK